MDINISEDKVTVNHNGTEYEFEKGYPYNNKLDDDKVLTPEDEELPQKVIQELEELNFFVRDLPKVITWNLFGGRLDAEDIVNEVSALEDVNVQEETKAVSSLYDALSGDYSGLEVKIRINEDESVEILGLADDEEFPKKFEAPEKHYK